MRGGGGGGCRRSKKIIKNFLSALSGFFVKTIEIFIVIELGCGSKGCGWAIGFVLGLRSYFV